MPKRSRRVGCVVAAAVVLSSAFVLTGGPATAHHRPDHSQGEKPAPSPSPEPTPTPTPTPTESGPSSNPPPLPSASECLAGMMWGGWWTQCTGWTGDFYSWLWGQAP